MRHPLALVLAVLAAGTAAAETPPAPETALVERLLGATPLIDDTRALTDGIGGRPAGSPAFDKAAAWAVERFKAAGLANARTETFTIPRSWRGGKEEARLTEGLEPHDPERYRNLRIAAMPYSAATPPDGLEAEVVDVQDGGTLPQMAAAPRLKGRWALVHSGELEDLAGLFAEYMDAPGILAGLREKGAVGVLWMSSRPGRLVYRHLATHDGTVFPLPIVVVERDAALWMGRTMAQKRTLRVRVVSRPLIVENATSVNVVAEIPGSDLAKEEIVLGAHLDSWDLGRGALDNGCNAALVVDVARQMKAAGVAPRRTVRFVLYGAEENGLWGSRGDVQRRRDTLDALRAQITFDMGSGKVTGFSLGGRTDLRDAVDAALAPVARRLGPFQHTPDAFVGTDNFDYLIEGVPTLVPNQDAAAYVPDYHASSDTFDKVDGPQLRQNAAVAGALVAGLASLDPWPAPRQDRAAVEALIEATGVAGQMKVFGLWDAFAAGTRGRSR